MVVGRHHELSPHRYAGRFARRADAAATLVARHAASELLRRCGLEVALERARRVELLQARGEVLGPAAEAPGLDAKALGKALRSFYSALFSDPTPAVAGISDDDRKAAARLLAHATLAKAHGAIHALAADAGTGGYADDSFLVHSPAQVRVLLDVPE